LATLRAFAATCIPIIDGTLIPRRALEIQLAARSRPDDLMSYHILIAHHFTLLMIIPALQPSWAFW
jgi:hypothetical protein